MAEIEIPEPLDGAGKTEDDELAVLAELYGDEQEASDGDR
jgi:hypothetical protein